MTILLVFRKLYYQISQSSVSELKVCPFRANIYTCCRWPFHDSDWFTLGHPLVVLSISYLLPSYDPSPLFAHFVAILPIEILWMFNYFDVLSYQSFYFNKNLCFLKFYLVIYVIYALDYEKKL